MGAGSQEICLYEAKPLAFGERGEGHVVQTQEACKSEVCIYEYFTCFFDYHKETPT